MKRLMTLIRENISDNYYGNYLLIVEIVTAIFIVVNEETLAH